MIGETVSHYRILEKLGGGGMGVVYRAEDTRLGRIVALKFLAPELTRDPRAKQRFINEARAASQLDHPNICTIHEIDETEDGRLFLSLACYEGETARERLEKGPMPLDEAVAMGVHVAKGLAEAHSRGIVHRDIKPANIFLSNDGRARILDFGLAKLAGQTRLTRVGGTVGTVAYMSPEQARGTGDVSAGTDIWSLGVVLYEALTGELPFPGERPESILYSLVHESPRPPSELRADVPAKLEAIVMKCLEKDPDDRFRTASELVEELNRFRGHASSLIRAGTTARIPLRAFGRRRALVAAGAALVVCAGLLIVPQGRDAVRGLLAGRALPDLRQVAVLPLDAPENSTDEELAGGLRDYLTFRLSQIEQFDPALRVVPLKELQEHGVESPAEAAAVSGATLAIGGALRKEGDGLRLTLELLDAASGRRLRAWSCSDDPANVAAFQDDPVLAAAEMLGSDVGPQGRRILASGGTTVPAAFDAYLRGLGRLASSEARSPDGASEAVALLEKATEFDPSYALAFADLGRACWARFSATKDTADARRAAESAQRAAELDASIAKAYVTLGRSRRQLGDRRGAVLAFRQAIDADPVSLEARRQLAATAAAAGDTTLAETTYEEAIELRNRHWAPYYDMGLYYYRRGSNDEALKVLNEAAALAPGNAWPYILIGAIYFDTDRIEEAWTMMERSVEAEPSPEAYSNLGTLYFVGSRYADAARMYERAIELNETHYVTWGNLAAACDVVPGEQDDARECYRRALELAEGQLVLTPEDESLLASIASYCAELGRTEKAWEYLRRVIEMSPEDDLVMFQIGLTCEVLGDREAALRWIDRALEHGFSRLQVESTPSLRDLCSDRRYAELAR